ncbi:MAG TPA: hypothetical protein PKN24_00305 [bacterium]|nr:hypothetical protein [bacterium]
MSHRKRNLIAGITIIAAGALSLFSQLSIVHSWGRILLILLCGLTGGLLYWQARDNQKSPGIWPFLLVLIALLLLLPMLWPASSQYTMAVALAAFSIFFGCRARRNPDKWWLVLLSGTLFTLSAVYLLRELSLLSENNQLALFWFGLAFTFFYLKLQQPVTGGFAWLWIAIIGFFLLAGVIHLGTFISIPTDVILPFLLILIGIGFIALSIITHRKTRKQL